LEQLIEKGREFNLQTQLVYTNFEKVFDKFSRTVLWNILANRGYPKHLI